MSEAPIYSRPLAVPPAGARTHAEPRVAAQAAVDLRVEMVLQVLGGRTVEDVSEQWDIEAQILHRWVRDFLVAGTAMVTNRPDPDQARPRDRFLAAFAHELRSPVTVARGWAMAVEDGDVPEDQVTEAVGHVARAMARLSEKLLDIELAASVSLGRVRVEAEAVTVAAVLQKLPGSAELREGGDLVVCAAPDLLRIILRDLLQTAGLDPTPTSVAVDVIETGAWHEIRVVREGAPLSPLRLKALFDPFGSNDDTSGVTMGLYLARALTVAHGGILGAEGDEDTTVLYTRLPKDPALGSGVTRLGPGGNEGGNT